MLATPAEHAAIAARIARDAAIENASPHPWTTAVEAALDHRERMLADAYDYPSDERVFG